MQRCAIEIWYSNFFDTDRNDLCSNGTYISQNLNRGLRYNNSLI